MRLSGHSVGDSVRNIVRTYGLLGTLQVGVAATEYCVHSKGFGSVLAMRKLWIVLRTQA